MDDLGDLIWKSAGVAKKPTTSINPNPNSNNSNLASGSNSGNKAAVNQFTHQQNSINGFYNGMINSQPMGFNNNVNNVSNTPRQQPVNPSPFYPSVNGNQPQSNNSGAFAGLNASVSLSSSMSNNAPNANLSSMVGPRPQQSASKQQQQQQQQQDAFQSLVSFGSASSSSGNSKNMSLNDHKRVQEAAKVDQNSARSSTVSSSWGGGPNDSQFDMFFLNQLGNNNGANSSTGSRNSPSLTSSPIPAYASGFGVGGKSNNNDNNDFMDLLGGNGGNGSPSPLPPAAKSSMIAPQLSSSPANKSPWDLDLLTSTSPMPSMSMTAGNSTSSKVVASSLHGNNSHAIEDDLLGDFQSASSSPVPAVSQQPPVKASSSRPLPPAPVTQASDSVGSIGTGNREKESREAAVNRLVTMGFDRESASNALIAHGMDVSAAVESLIAMSAASPERETLSGSKGFAANVTSMGLNFFQKASTAIQNTKAKLINVIESGSNGNLSNDQVGFNYNNNVKNNNNNMNNKIVEKNMATETFVIPQKPAPVKSIKPQVYAAPEIVSAAEGAKEKGNVLFKQGNYADAEAEYSKGIELLPPGHALLVALSNNRASCRLKTGNNRGAVEDANVALGISENDGKALLRRANAFEAMEKFPEALKDYKLLQTIDPNTKGLAQSIARVSKGHKQMEKGFDGQAMQQEPSINSMSSNVPKKQDDFTLEFFDSLSSKTPQIHESPKITAEDVKSNDPEIRAAQEAAVEKLKQRDQEIAMEEQQKLFLKDSVDAKVMTWKSMKETNLRALLSSLETILWPELGWKPVNLSDLLLPNKVKIQYMKAIGKLHPDKLGPLITLEQKMLANAIFSSLNDAWDAFKQQNNM